MVPKILGGFNKNIGCFVYIGLGAGNGAGLGDGYWAGHWVGHGTGHGVLQGAGVGHGTCGPRWSWVKIIEYLMNL